MGTGESRIIQVTLKAVADMSDVTSNVRQIQNLLSQLKLSPNLKGDFTKIFGDIEKNMERASQAMANGFKTKGDVKAYSTAMEAIERALISMQTNMEKIKPGAFSELLKDNQDLQAALQASATQLQTFKQELASKIAGTDAFKELNKDIDTFKNGLKSASVDTFFKKLGEGDIPGAEKALKRLDAVVEKQKKDLQAKGMTTGWEKSEQLVARLRQGLQAIASDGSVQSVRQQMTKLEQSMKNMSAAELDKLKKEFQQLTGVDLSKLIEEFRRLYGEGLKSGQATQKLNSELDQFKSRISYFFGMTNAVMLFRRALRSTFETVKDLDKVMTETAVVTEFDVGDMWSQLPEYTERANQLGVSIHDAYEAATLYYQQGLSTNEVMAVSNETLKMARIAGLDAADATDRMTNALRGFNMEITESNAQNINDVYSNLAAKTASNVDEISTAMTKVASLAHNANMSFENTAAFLSQIIETTRESAETAGTALKTVIARFSEVKKLYSTGDLLGTDEEGEEINVNKVSAALRTAGINLNEYLTGMKGLDEIFMELSEKWDSLDQVQQRYIATMAAGSRQQSRFIALMQDNARMTELVSYANNAAGASEGQFEKTLESLESKLNELKNTWNTFLMGIANSDAIKFAVDALTNLFKTLNKISENLPGLAKSFANIAILIGGFKIGRGLLSKIFPSLAATFGKIGLRGGTEAAVGWVSNFKKGLASSEGNILGAFGTLFTKKVPQMSSMLTEDMEKQMMQATSGLEHQDEILLTYRTKGYEAAQKEANDYGEKIGEVNEETKAYNQVAEQQMISLGNLGNAFLGLGGVVMLIGRLFDDGSESGKKVAKTLTIIGASLMGVGAAMKVIGTITDVLGIKVAKTATVAGGKIALAGGEALVGWAPFLATVLAIIAAVAALTVLVVAIVKIIKNNSPEGKLKKAKEATEQAKKAAEETKEAYDNLKSSIESLSEKQSSLEELARGTREWRDAVQQVNSETLELMNSYKELIPYVKNNEGVLTIDFDDEQVQKILDQYSNSTFYAASGQALAEKNELELEVAVDYDKLSRKMGGFLKKNTIDTVAKALAGNTEALKTLGSFSPRGEDETETDYIRRILADMQGVPNTFAYVTEDIAAQLREYGSTLSKTEVQQQAYTNAIAANAAALADVPEALSNYVANYLNNDRVEGYIEQEEAKIQEGLSGNVFSASQYMTELRKEYAEAMGKSSYEEIKKENDGKDIDKDTIISTVAAARAQDRATEAAENFASEFEDLPDSIKRVYEKEEGGALTREDIERDILSDLSPFERIRKMFDVTEARIKGAARFENTRARLGTRDEGLSRTNASKLDSKNYEIFADNLLKIISASGDGAGAADRFVRSFNEITKSMSQEEINKFMDELGKKDWKDLNQINNLRSDMEAADIAIASSDDQWNEFINSIIEGMGAISKLSPEEAIAQIGSKSELARKIRSGDQKEDNFSEEDYALLIDSNAELAKDFIKVGDEYHYIGSDMTTLADALSENTAALLESTSEQLDTKIGVGEILSKYTGEGLDTGANLYQQQQAINYLIKKSVEQGLDLSQLGIKGLSNQSKGADFDETQTSSTINAILQVLTEYKNGLYGQQKEAVNTQGTSNAASGNTARQNAAMAGSTGGEEYAKMLIDQAEQAGVAKESVDKYREALQSTDELERGIAARRMVKLMDLQKEIELYGLDAEAISDYAKRLMEADSSLDFSEAMSQAKTFTRLSRGLESLADNYEDWTGLVDESGRIIRKFGTKSESTFNDLKDAIEDVADVGDELPDTFLENKDNVDLLRRAIEGDVEALQDLQTAARAAAAQQYAIDVVSNLDTTAFDEQLSGFADWCASVDLPNLEAGATLYSAPYLQGLYDILEASNATADQIKAFFDALGFTVEYERVPITMEVMGTEFTKDDNGNVTDVKPVPKTVNTTLRVGKPVFTYKGGGVPNNISMPTAPSTGSCFVAGTLISTFSGLKPIESIQAGDIVLSYNERTHQNEYSAVLQTMIHDVTENIYTLHIENDILEVTGIHRFYITRNNKKSWISVQDFQENDLVQFADGTLHRIEKIEVEVRTTRVYNFEVSNNHNYYVGENQILAHNKGGGGCFAAGTLVTLQGFYKNIEQVSVGDVVLSYNEEKKKNEYSTVVQTMIHFVKEKIYTLYVGRDKLVVTGIHRFYITREEGASWIPAEELCVGDKVRFADGTLHDITKISTEEKSLIVYNFEVSNTHNYYVGRSQILAHNKGGGGGGSDKTEHWDNPYDELFNLQEKINGAIRKRNKLEEKYNDLIRSSKGATKDLQKENKNILKNLQTQLSLQKDMRKGRLKQIRNVGKETYYNGDKATTFEKMNVTKYASLNTSTGEVKINWKALNKLSGKTDKDSIATGQAAEAYISRLQELADQLNETNDTIRDIKEEIREQHQQNLDNVTEFQQRAMDAYIDSKEREIDAIEELYDSIEESTQNVLQGIQDQIAEQRKARENEKTEKDLADKEARLAYLQRDTSGANQAEIMSLQKEIDEARQDYEDTLIDQTIDQMSKDADLAAEQRAKQIEIMREQLDTAKENGTYWKKVNQMINDSRNKGVINKQSDLWKMIEQSESYKGMSKQQQYAFRKELLEQENSAFAGVKDTNTEMVFTTKQREAIATAIAKGTKKNDYNGWGSGKTRTKRLTDLFGSNDAKAIENLVKNKGKKLNTGKPADNEYGDWKKKMQGFTVYKTGGLADFTGPAWLDGTKTKPEIILNAADSKNLIILKDVLASLLSGKNSSNSKDNGGDNYFDIDITAELKNDYDVDQLAARIKKQIQQDGQYRNVNAISFLR